jgi:hypothetical protein
MHGHEHALNPGAASDAPPPGPVVPVAGAAATAAPAPPVATGNCPNCNAPLYGPFCYACGQSKRGLIRHFSTILGDFLDSVLQIDSRTLRTLLPLYLKPGFLTNEYFAGRRVRYVTPLRLYFFLSIVAFLVISLVSRLDVSAGSDGLRVGYQVDAQELAALPPEQRQQRLEDVERELRFLPESERAKVRTELERAIADAQQRGARAEQAPTEAGKAERLGGAIEQAERAAAREDEPIYLFSDEPWNPKTNPVRVSWLSDSMNQALNEEIGVLIRKARKLEDDPAPFIRQMFALAPQALFLILPLFALLLKVFYLFKRRLYMEHLIVALHSHSFICLSMLVLVALYKLGEWTAGWPVLPTLLNLGYALAWIWLPLHLLLMQHRVYRQHWFVTLLMYGVIGTCYLVLLSFAMLLTMLASLVTL